MPVVVKNHTISSNDITSGGVFDTKVNRDGLVFYVDAGDTDSYPGSGNIWYDLSGYGNNGTLYNGVAFTSDNGGALIFDGSDDYMQANVSTTLLDGDPQMTVEMFVKRTASFSSAGFWGVGGAGQGYGLEGWTPVTNRIYLDLYDSNRVNSGVDYPLNTYVHVAWVKHTTTVNINTVICYINGVGYGPSSLVLDRGTTSNPRLNTSTSGVGISLGRISPNASGYNAPITMGYFRVYTRALSGFEIFENFQATRGRFGI
jgi:hypothetical protein